MRLFNKLLGLLASELLKYFARHYRKLYPRMALFANDTISRKILVYGRYEKEYLQCLKEHFLKGIDPNKICLDLGANIGNHSLAFSGYFKQVHAFEPNQKAYKLLCYNADLAPNIITHSIGASDKNAVYSALEKSGNQGATSIVQVPEKEKNIWIMNDGFSTITCPLN